MVRYFESYPIGVPVQNILVRPHLVGVLRSLFLHHLKFRTKLIKKHKPLNTSVFEGFFV
jgi:hypothetical protein